MIDDQVEQPLSCHWRNNQKNSEQDSSSRCFH